MTDASQSVSTTHVIGLLANAEQPVGLDAIEVKPDGSIVRWPRETLVFTFDFQGATFTAQGRKSAERFQVAFDASLGPLPFTAESLERRRAIQGLVVAKANEPGPSITIDNAMDIRVAGQFDVQQPISPVAVLTGLTEILLELKPWLARLAELLGAPAPTNAVSSPSG